VAVVADQGVGGAGVTVADDVIIVRRRVLDPCSRLVGREVAVGRVCVGEVVCDVGQAAFDAPVERAVGCGEGVVEVSQALGDGVDGGSTDTNSATCVTARPRRPPERGELEVMNSQQPAAVLFDMDGTLVDSEKVWEIALHELAAWAGGTLSPEARRAMVGSSMANSMRIFREDLGQPDRPEEPDVKWLTSRVFNLFREGLVWQPGAAELLRAVKIAGLPTALVTSTGRLLVEAALDTLGRENFDVVVCGDEVTMPKPDPEPYRTAATLLGVPIELCVAIEDSPTGVASALASGAVVLAVPAELELPPTDGVHLRRSLVGVDPAYLASLLISHELLRPGH
jgi:HAD superfamily hydrolase (TIGR01509 family)